MKQLCANYIHVHNYMIKMGRVFLCRVKYLRKFVAKKLPALEPITKFTLTDCKQRRIYSQFYMFRLEL